MTFRPILAAAAALLLLAPAPAIAAPAAQSEIDLGDDFEIDLEEAPARPKAVPWKLATTREGLIAQEAELETELESLARVLRAAGQRKWLWPKFKGAERAGDFEIRDADRAIKLLDAGVQSGDWTSAQASQLRARFEDENARAVRGLRVREINFKNRLGQVQAALKK